MTETENVTDDVIVGDQDKVIVAKDLVLLDKANLIVNETNLNTFLSNFASKYDYFNKKHSAAHKVFHSFEDKHEAIYCKRYTEYKEGQGCTDKLADAKAKTHETVIAAKAQSREAKYRKDLIWGYLRSMDKAHEDAIQLGYNLRKEMDKLHTDIKTVYES